MTALGNIAIMCLNVKALDIIFGPFLTGGRNKFDLIETAWIILRSLSEVGVYLNDPTALLPEIGINQTSYLLTKSKLQSPTQNPVSKFSWASNTLPPTT